MRKTGNKSGYTLVDTIVSLALFSIVVLVCVGVLVTVVNANRKERSLKQAMDNLNVVIENISRTAKTGSKYYCSNSLITIIPCTGQVCSGGQKETQDCHTGDSMVGTRLGLRDKNGYMVFYWFDSTNHCVAKKMVTSQQWGNYTDDGSNYSCITDPAVYISNMRFYVYNTVYYNPNDSSTFYQPRVIFTVSGYAGIDVNTRTNFNLMTSASQRAPHNGEK